MTGLELPNLARVSGDLMYPSEQALWLLSQYAPEDGVLNVPLTVRRHGFLDGRLVEATVRQLVRRHPSLRTRFPAVDGLPVRVTLEPGDPDATVPVETVPTSPETVDEDLRRFAARPFDLARAIPVRAGHFVGCPDGHLLCLVIHHIVIDGSSINVLYRELVEVYRGLSDSGEIPQHLRGTVSGLAAPPPASDESTRFWRARLSEAGEPAGELAIGQPGRQREGFTGGYVRRPLSDAAVRSVARLAARLRVTHNTLLFGIYALLLSGHGLGRNVVIGTPVDVRDRSQPHSVGFRANILAIPVQISPEQAFAGWARSVRDSYLTSLRHSQVSIDEVLPGSYHTADGWRRPLFRHLFNYAKQGTVSDRVWGDFEPVPVHTGYSRLDLDLLVQPVRRGLNLRLVYSDELYRAHEAATLLARFEELLLACARDPEVPIASLPRWDRRERTTVTGPATTGKVPASAGAPPAEETELVRAICAELLNRPDLPADADVFAHGGTSIMAARLVARLKQLRGVRLSLRRVLTTRTPAAVAALVAEQREG